MAPEIPEEILASDLDRAARGRLRTLSKDNADGVARHLVMAGRLIDEDPELAYAHAQAAVRRAGRVDVVREAAALTAYRTGRYAEALRELRTVRRLNGSDEHLALMADCERGLGRPDRALALSQDDAVRDLPAEAQVELAIVVSGARLDLGDPSAALAALSAPLVRAAVGELAERVVEARATALEAAGRSQEAAELLRGLPGYGTDDREAIVVFDLEDEDEASEESGDGPSANEAHVGTSEDDVPEGEPAAGRGTGSAPSAAAEIDVETSPGVDQDPRPAELDHDEASPDGVAGGEDGDAREDDGSTGGTLF